MTGYQWQPGGPLIRPGGQNEPVLLLAGERIIPLADATPYPPRPPWEISAVCARVGIAVRVALWAVLLVVTGTGNARWAILAAPVVLAAAGVYAALAGLNEARDR